MTKILVVLSGGQDSTLLLFRMKKYYKEVHAITFDYGQRHLKEIQSARVIARFANVASHEVVELGPILKGTSPLTDPDAPLETYRDQAHMDQVIGNRLEQTFVPLRNALFLTVAANRAYCMGIDTIALGACRDDIANYPDCRPAFFEAMERSLSLALGWRMKIDTPFVHILKSEAIFQASPEALHALGFSHTCYAGEFPPCGKCHACILRAHGFKEAGVADPLLVQNV